jgi:hypothetical protein
MAEGWISKLPSAYGNYTALAHIRKLNSPSLIHRQNIICGVAFDRSSLRRIASYASVVAPRPLTSDVLPVIKH